MLFFLIFFFFFSSRRRHTRLCQVTEFRRVLFRSKNFDAVGGFDEKLFIGEEIYFSMALRKLGRFKILRDPSVTSGRKLRMYSAREILGNFLSVILRGPRAARSRA